MKKYQLTINQTSYNVLIKEVTETTVTADVNGEIHVIAVENIQNVSPLLADTDQLVAAAPTTPQVPVSSNGEVQPARVVKHSGSVLTPIPGQIININVSKGDKVLIGQKLMVLEAMKLENVIAAPIDGTVKIIPISEGDVVQQGQLLIEID